MTKYYFFNRLFGLMYSFKLLFVFLLLLSFFSGGIAYDQIGFENGTLIEAAVMYSTVRCPCMLFLFLSLSLLSLSLSLSISLSLCFSVSYYFTLPLPPLFLLLLLFFLFLTIYLPFSHSLVFLFLSPNHSVSSICF